MGNTMLNYMFFIFIFTFIHKPRDRGTGTSFEEIVHIASAKRKIFKYGNPKYKIFFVNLPSHYPIVDQQYF